jgi:hypothetical protein
VEQLYDTNPGLILYGLYTSPLLDVVETWDRTLNFSVSPDSHKASVVLWEMVSCFELVLVLVGILMHILLLFSRTSCIF